MNDDETDDTNAGTIENDPNDDNEVTNDEGTLDNWLELLNADELELAIDDAAKERGKNDVTEEGAKELTADEVVGSELRDVLTEEILGTLLRPNKVLALNELGTEENEAKLPANGPKLKALVTDHGAKLEAPNKELKAGSDDNAELLTDAESATELTTKLEAGTEPEERVALKDGAIDNKLLVPEDNADRLTGTDRLARIEDNPATDELTALILLGIPDNEASKPTLDNTEATANTEFTDELSGANEVNGNEAEEDKALDEMNGPEIKAGILESDNTGEDKLNNVEVALAKLFAKALVANDDAGTLLAKIETADGNDGTPLNNEDDPNEYEETPALEDGTLDNA